MSNCLMQAAKELVGWKGNADKFAIGLGLGTGGMLTRANEIWWPDKTRGWHIQEIVETLLERYKIALVPHTVNPALAPYGEPELARPLYQPEECAERLIQAVTGRKAILIYPNHAVYYNGTNPSVARSLINEADKIIEAWVAYTVK